VVAVLIAASVLLIPLPLDNVWRSRMSLAVIFAVIGLSVNVITGHAGQISLGHQAFVGIGAFVSAYVVARFNFGVSFMVAGLTGAVLALILGLVALRIRGLYLALITLGLAVLFPRVAAKVVDGPDALIQGSGGVALLRPERSEFESIIGFLDNDQWEYFLCLAVAVVAYVLARNLISSRMGRAIIATRDREIAAATVGVNLSGVKVGTFALSAAYAGVAGSLAVMVDKVADATNPILYFELSIKFLVAVVIGGAATILGPALGAVVLTFLEDRTDTLIEGKEVLSPALLGIALIIIVFVLPEGLLGGIRRLVNKASTRWAGRKRSADGVSRS
jgi:branched-chain amino acid transport system permease protein